MIATGRRALIKIGIAALMVLLILVVIRALDIVLLAFAGVLLAVFLRGLTDTLSERTRLPPVVSLIVVLLLLIALVAGLVWLTASRLEGQFEALPDQMDEAIRRLRHWLQDTTWARRVLSETPDAGERITEEVTLKGVGGFASTTFKAIASPILVIFVGLYLSYDPELYIRGLVKLLPVAYRPRARELIARMGYTLRRWLLARLVSMAVVGVMTGVGLWLLGIPLALVLGLLAGVLSFMPYIGTVLSLVPAVLIAVLQGPGSVASVLVLYLVVQTIEGKLITPLLEWGVVAIPPALTLVVQLVLGMLAGFLGLLLATPLLATAIVLIQTLYIEDVLGDRDIAAAPAPT